MKAVLVHCVIMTIFVTIIKGDESIDEEALKQLCLKTFYGRTVSNVTRDGCVLQCTTETKPEDFDDYYGYVYGRKKRSLDHSAIVKTEFIKMTKLENCGDKMVCFEGTCQNMDPENQDICESLTPGSLAIQLPDRRTTPCQRNCAVNRYEWSTKADILQVNMPNESKCADGMLCNEGSCLNETRFISLHV